MQASLADFEPKSSNDLAISRQKLTEIRNWFSNRFIKSSPPNSQPKVSPFLLLNGPAGSAKTITVKLLCKEFNVQLVELPTTFIFKEKDDVTDDLEHLSLRNARSSTFNISQVLDEPDPIKSIFAVDQINRFKRFIYDLNYCKNTLVTNPKESPFKLLLIEDIPQIFHHEPELMHEELTSLYRVFKSNTVPIVFIISDTVNGPSVEYKVLPKSIQAKLNFQVISFKPVTNASLTKVIGKASSSKNLSKSEIEEIVLASSNDIRNAFNYFTFRHSNTHNKYQFSNTKKTKLGLNIKSGAKTKTISNKTIESGREEQLTVMHAMGKVLYAKRSPNEDADVLDFISTFPHVHRSLHRNPLMEEQPEAIAERANVSCDTVADWVYENYHDFISKDSLEHAVDCLEVLSMNN